MKRMISLLLCLLLVMSMAMTTFATGEEPENPPATTEKVSLTIRGKATGHTYVAYQIFKGGVATKGEDGVISDIQWGESITNPEAFVAALKADETPIVNSANTQQSTTFAEQFENATASASSVADVMKNWGDDLDRINYFAEFLWESGYLSTDWYKDTTSSTTTYTFTDMEPGYYMIKDKEDTINNTANDFYTSFIISLTSNTNIEVKGSVPSVNKRVSDTLNGQYSEYVSNQINRLHYYEWVGKMPSEIADYDFYSYVFEDTMSESLDFNRIEEIYIKTTNGEHVLYRVDADGAVIAGKKDNMDVWQVPDTGDAYTGGGTIRIGWTDLKKIYPTLLKSDEVYVRYSASLNEKAVVVDTGNPNTVKLHFSNNPNDKDDYGTTPPSTSRVYTFAMEVTKVNEAGETLQGAEFVLFHYHSEETENVPMYAIVEDGVITGWTEVQSDATPLVSGPDGKINVKGLKKDIDYYLTETKPPQGYNTLFGNTDIQITGYTVDETTKEVTSINYEVNNKVHEKSGKTTKVELSIENKSGTVLPSTGGMGTTLLYLAGGILVLAAVVLLVTKKRMASE